MTKTLQERFDESYRIEERTPCWIWTKSLDSHGYGQIAGPGASFRQAHRWAWTLFRGPIADGLCVLHKCDRPACVNPDHLFLGTQTENMADRQRKGRQPKGMPAAEMTRHVKLTEAAAISIYRDRRPLKEIAAAHGVSVGAVAKIRRGDRWGRVTRAG